jgi:transposase
MRTYIATRNEPQLALLNDWADLAAEVAKLRQQLAEAQDEIARLKRELEEAQRAGKRQAAPFAKGAPKAYPKRPGRKVGHVRAFRPLPPPSEIAATYDAPLPVACPTCGGAVTEERVAVQYQVELPPVRPVTSQFQVHVGHCQACGRHLQGHHPLQTSDALGAANIGLGPRALALAAEAKHDLGVPYAKIAHFFQSAFGLSVSRATFARADQRVAKALLPLYAQLLLALRHAAVVHVDETGWRIGGYSAWLWVFATPALTVYVVAFSRGRDVPQAVLGPDFHGWLVADGLRIYASLPYLQQKCLWHLLRNVRDLLEAKSGPAARFPRQLLALLRSALRLHHRQQAGQLTARGFASARGQLLCRCDRLLPGRLTDSDNAHLARRLQTCRAALFPFLYYPDLPPTNARAEQEIRPAVVMRKTSACNRAETGAHTHEVLASLLRTCRKQHQSFIDLTTQRLRDPHAPAPLWLASFLHPPPLSTNPP